MFINSNSNPFDPYDPYNINSSQDSTKAIESLILSKPDSKHCFIFRYLQTHKNLLRLFLELPEKYQEESILDMIDIDPYYQKQVERKYQYVSTFTPIYRKDTLVLKLELIYNDFKDVVPPQGNDGKI